MIFQVSQLMIAEFLPVVLFYRLLLSTQRLGMWNGRGCLHSLEEHFLNLLSIRVCLLVQSCPTVCNPMDCSQPGSFVHGILQTGILEWVAISYSNEILKNFFFFFFGHATGLVGS